MKKIFSILALSLMVVSVGHASKLSKYVHQAKEREQARDQREWQQDMDFNNFTFRLVKRYLDDRGQRCRDYEFRARAFRHGYYTVCDER